MIKYINGLKQHIIALYKKLYIILNILLSERSMFVISIYSISIIGEASGDEGNGGNVTINRREAKNIY